jgi:catechol 2,3-dioxygenase-like lactoylglutathione lyase family enzyme
VQVLSSRVLLRPSDLDRSIAFYRDRLGLHVYREYGSGQSRGVVFFLGGGFLEVSGSAAVADQSQWVGLWLQVPDAAEAERDLRAAGVDVRTPARRMPWGLVELEARDPDGVRLVVVEVPDDHPLRRRLD